MVGMEYGRWTYTIVSLSTSPPPSCAIVSDGNLPNGPSLGISRVVFTSCFIEWVWSWVVRVSKTVFLRVAFNWAMSSQRITLVARFNAEVQTITLNRGTHSKRVWRNGHYLLVPWTPDLNGVEHGVALESHLVCDALDLCHCNHGGIALVVCGHTWSGFGYSLES